MSDTFKGLEPKNLWKHFEEIIKIPHCSENEKALGDHIISIAKKLNLKWDRDKAGNVVVSKKASKGMEKAEGVILQGHLDMVCEKNSDVKHDFSKDPIQTEKSGDWIKAKGTTLGADNGIGLAASLAIMEDDSLKHPPLEFLFTVEEETGLKGAAKIAKGFLKGKKLLNLDSEDEGEFTIGCAGGADTILTLPLKRQKEKQNDLYQLKITGLRGGHSGIDINQGRANAIKLLARMLWKAQEKSSFSLVSIDGGNLRNAIPREAWAELYIDPSKKKEILSIFKKEFDDIKKENQAVEKDPDFTFEKSNNTGLKALLPKVQLNLIGFLYTLPHGVITMHPEMKDLVETSNNLAVIRSDEKKAEIICSTRSSISSALENTRSVIVALSRLVKAKVNLEEGYPGWTPNLQSPLLKKLQDVYSTTFKKEPHVAAIHAGLECGIIGEKFPGMDMISFGPTIEHPHSPDERVNVPTVEKFWKFLTISISKLG
jgi:dipeptidase D